MDIQNNSPSDQQDQDFQFVAENLQCSKQQTFFDHVVALIQEIVISPEFETKIQQFFGDNLNSIQNVSETIQKQIFNKFRTTFTSYLTQKLSAQIPNFDIKLFFQLLKDRKDQVDDQLLDTLESMIDINCFHELMKASKTSHDEVQTYKVLTIKSNKIPQNKTVKGKDNIFGGPSHNPLFDAKMIKPLKSTKQQKMIEKTEDQLLVPDLVLTVKAIRKD